MHTWNLPCDRLGILSISSILPQILPQTSSQTQGNSRVSRGKLERNRMEHQTPSVFPGNFRKRKVLGTLCFPFCFPETLVEPNKRSQRKINTGQGRNLLDAPARNEPELGQGFTLSSSRPSQSIPGLILRLVRSGIYFT